MEYYRVPRWAGLRNEILKAFDAERALHKYRPTDVVNLAKETTKQPILNMTQWHKYCIRYKTIAGGLYTEGRFAEENYRAYFWFGIPKDLRQSLEARILQGRSLQNTTGYSIHEINAAAEWHFRRNRAEALLLDASEFGFEEYDGEDDSDTDSEASESDSEYERRRTRKKKKKGTSNPRKKESSKSKTLTTAKVKAKYAGNEEEIAGMIKQLNGMRLEDPDYAPTYYKVLAMDQTGNAAHYPPNPTVGRVPEGAPVASISSKPTAATYPNNIPLGEMGLMTLCREGYWAITRRPGALRCDPGVPLRRLAGESILDAAERIQKETQGTAVMFTFAGPPVSTANAVRNFYQAHAWDEATEASEWEEGKMQSDGLPSDMEDSDTDDNTVYLSVPRRVQFRDEPVPVYEADRTVTKIRQARRSAFDGVEMPPRRQGLRSPETGQTASRLPDRGTLPKAGPSVPEPAAQVSPGVTTLSPLPSSVSYPQARPPTPPKTAQRKKPVNPEPRPTDARTPRTVPMDVDGGPLPIRTHDSSIPKDPVDPVRGREAGKNVERDWGAHRPVTRQSAISATVDRTAVTNRVLDTTVEMSLRELMEVSKDVRTEFTELIRVRNPKVVLMSARRLPGPLVGNVAWPRTDGVLIKVEMMSGDSIICAIIDTGSQLNVVRGELARLKIKHVVDMTQVINMNDANGGSGQLRGMIRGAELVCGGLRTTADLWVSEQAPFELLLGRPWQRANKVSIDERKEGTYLVFKDATTGRPRFEMLAAPAEDDMDSPFVQFQAVACLHFANEIVECVASYLGKPRRISKFGAVRKVIRMGYAILTEYAEMVGRKIEGVAAAKRPKLWNAVQAGAAALWGMVALFNLTVFLRGSHLPEDKIRRGHEVVDNRDSWSDPERWEVEQVDGCAHDSEPGSRNIGRTSGTERESDTEGHGQGRVEQSEESAYWLELADGRGNGEYKGNLSLRTVQPPRSELSLSSAQRVIHHWLNILLTRIAPVAVMDLRFPSPPPPVLLTPPTLAPPMLPNEVEVSVARTLAMMRANHTTLNHIPPSFPSSFPLRHIPDHLLLRHEQPLPSPMAPSMELRPIRPLPRRARLSREPARQPTPYPHPDEAVTEAVRRIQVAMLDGMVAKEGRGRADFPQKMEEVENTILAGGDEPMELSTVPIDTSSSIAEPESPATATAVGSIQSLIELLSGRKFRGIDLDNIQETSQEVVNGLHQVGLPRFRQPATLPAPLHPPVPELEPAIQSFLRQYLQGAPVLVELARAVEEVRQVLAPAQQTEMYTRVLAGILPTLEARAADAQSQLDPGLVHGWTIFFESVRAAHDVLAERARVQSDEVFRAAEEYHYWMRQVNEEIDARGEMERAAYRQALLDITNSTSHLVPRPTPIGEDDRSAEELGEGAFGSAVGEWADREMEEAQRSMAALRLHDGDGGNEHGTAWGDMDYDRDTRSQAIRVPWTLSASTTRSASPEVLTVEPFLVIDERTPSPVLFFDYENSSPDTSSEGSRDDRMQQLLANARDLAHQGRYEEAREYWWDALNSPSPEEEFSSPSAGELHSRSDLATGSEREEDQGFRQDVSTLRHLLSASLEPYNTVGETRAKDREERLSGLESLVHSSLILDDPAESQGSATTHEPPPEPEVHRRSGARVLDNRPWYQPESTYTNNNPCMPRYHNHQSADEVPVLRMSDYARVGAFQKAPLAQETRTWLQSPMMTSPPSLATTPPLTMSPSTDSPGSPPSLEPEPQPFTRYLTKLRQTVFALEGPDSVGGKMDEEFRKMERALSIHHALVFSQLHQAAHQAYNRNGLGQLIDYERMRQPNGQRVEFDWDVNEQPIVSDAERDELQEHFFYGNHFDLLHEASALRHSLLTTVKLALPYLGQHGADLAHGFYQWLQTHRYATRRRFFWIFPLLHRHEMGMCETLYSLLIEQGYFHQADELWRVLRVRYVCEDLLGSFLRNGFLDIDHRYGDAGYWTHNIPGLIFGDAMLTFDDGDNEGRPMEGAAARPESRGSFSYFTDIAVEDFDDDQSSPGGGDDEDVGAAFGKFSVGLPRRPPSFELALPAHRRWNGTNAATTASTASDKGGVSAAYNAPPVDPVANIDFATSLLLRVDTTEADALLYAQDTGSLDSDGDSESEGSFVSIELPRNEGGASKIEGDA
ncbi:hypothetical protein C8F01DRAFT_1251907 [Mycena amicta]|nr:hypothetical protein C8F01DRAFT_1251907 [Mycena amicta]